MLPLLLHCVCSCQGHKDVIATKSAPNCNLPGPVCSTGPVNAFSGICASAPCSAPSASSRIPSLLPSPHILRLLRVPSQTLCSCYTLLLGDLPCGFSYCLQTVTHTSLYSSQISRTICLGAHWMSLLGKPVGGWTSACSKLNSVCPSS